MIVSLLGGPLDGATIDAGNPAKRRLVVPAPISIFGVLAGDTVALTDSASCAYEIAMRGCCGGPCLHPERDSQGHPRYRYVRP